MVYTQISPAMRIAFMGTPDFAAPAEIKRAAVEAIEADRELQVAELVEDEVLLALPRFVECRPDCKGLCPTCGANLNQAACACTRDDFDPRFRSLKALLKS